MKRAYIKIDESQFLKDILKPPIVYIADLHSVKYRYPTYKLIIRAIANKFPVNYFIEGLHLVDQEFFDQLTGKDINLYEKQLNEYVSPIQIREERILTDDFAKEKLWWDSLSDIEKEKVEIITVEEKMLFEEKLSDIERKEIEDYLKLSISEREKIAFQSMKEKRRQYYSYFAPLIIPMIENLNNIRIIGMESKKYYSEDQGEPIAFRTKQLKDNIVINLSEDRKNIVLIGKSHLDSYTGVQFLIEKEKGIKGPTIFIDDEKLIKSYNLQKGIYKMDTTRYSHPDFLIVIGE